MLIDSVIPGDGGSIHHEIVGLLVDGGAKNTPDCDGVTPLDHARSPGFWGQAERIEAGPQG